MICPNCNQTILGHPDECYKCNYNFLLGKVITSLEQKTVELEQKKIALEKKKQEQEKDLIIRKEQLSKNALYEYDVVKIIDNASGDSDTDEIKRIIDYHALDGWRLSFVFANEIGKKSNSIGISGISSGINATIESTTLIFERCIKCQQN